MHNPILVMFRVKGATADCSRPKRTEITTAKMCLIKHLKDTDRKTVHLTSEPASWPEQWMCLLYDRWPTSAQ
jgi:hypothetical protein